MVIIAIIKLNFRILMDPTAGPTMVKYVQEMDSQFVITNIIFATVKMDYIA